MDNKPLFKTILFEECCACGAIQNEYSCSPYCFAESSSSPSTKPFIPPYTHNKSSSSLESSSNSFHSCSPQSDSLPVEINEHLSDPPPSNFPLHTLENNSSSNEQPPLNFDINALSSQLNSNLSTIDFNNTMRRQYLDYVSQCCILVDSHSSSSSESDYSLNYLFCNSSPNSPSSETSPSHISLSLTPSSSLRSQSSSECLSYLSESVSISDSVVNSDKSEDSVVEP